MIDVSPRVSIIEAMVGLPVARVRFHLAAVGKVQLPSFSGSTFRGLLGHALKAVACAEGSACAECRRPETCVYRYLFETSDPSGGDDASRPFVLEPPGRKDLMLDGTPFELDMVLMGRGTEYLAHFIFCIDDMGRRGIGERSDRFKLTGASWQSPDGSWQRFYEGGSGRTVGHLLWEPAPLDLAQWIHACPGEPGQATMNFLTPTRLVHQGNLVTRPDFHILIRSLLRRLDSLMRIHRGSALAVDFKNLVWDAMKINTVQDDTQWFEWERRSQRQNRSMHLGGLVGTVRFQGDLAPYIHLLQAGTLTHVGKATTFGLGGYQVSFRRSHASAD